MDLLYFLGKPVIISIFKPCVKTGMDFIEDFIGKVERGVPLVLPRVGTGRVPIFL